MGMRRMAALLFPALLGLTAAVRATTSLEAVKAGGFPSLGLEDARELPAPPSAAGRRAGRAADLVPFLDKRYQLGGEWGKKPVTAASLAQESAVFQRAAKATAHFGAGTAFYLGKFNGRHLMATNAHVMEYRLCERLSANFVLLRRRFQCDKEYGEWPEIDLSVFSIRVPAEEEGLLSGLGGNFAFEARIYPGQELLTVGFGTEGNDRNEPMANRDADCKVFSGPDEFRQMADPDDPGSSRKVWSFADGCDVSHGDSGSAMVDRHTGEVLGILWGGHVPKSSNDASSAYLDRMLAAQSGEIWTELTYAVPAPRIRETLAAALARGMRDPDAQRTIGALLGPSTAP